MRKEKRFAPGRHGASVLREVAQLLCAVIASLWLAGCNDDYADNVSTARNQLEVSVKTNLTKAGTGLITGNFLPDGATLGVTLRKSDGSSYDGQDYTNVLYTATGTESEQTWAGPAQNPILLSATEGTAYAYFPRQSDLADITQIPISNETETDYMVSHPANNLSIANKTATFNMEHVMSVIRCTVVKGNYTGTGSISSISVKGNTAATNAKLNVLTQQLSDITGTGTAITKEGSWTLTNITDQDLWTVPSGESSALTFAVSVDGNNMMAASEALEILPGKIYTYTLTINSNTLTISKVNVTDWDIVAKENLTPMLKPAEETLTWATAPDGVYAVAVDLTPVLVANADETCVAVAIVNSATGKKFMIEKNETNSASYRQAHIAFGGMNATGLESNPEETRYLSAFNWGGGYEICEGISKAATIDGSTERKTVGYFGGTDASLNLSEDPSEWTTGALSDFSGLSNNAKLTTLLTNEIMADGYNFTPIGYMVNYFNASDSNLGLNDWFVPTVGYGALILLNATAVDEALLKIGGTQMLTSESTLYWTATQYAELVNDRPVSYVFGKQGSVKQVKTTDRYYPLCVRLIRDIE